MPAADDDLPVAEPAHPTPDPSPHGNEEPVLGEPVTDFAALDKVVPVIDPIRPEAEIAEPVLEAAPLPVAHPVPRRPPFPRAAPAPAGRAVGLTFPTSPVRDPAPTEPPPKPQWIMACSVIGCLGVVALAAVGFLVYVAILILGQVGELTNRIGPDEAGGTAARRPEPITATQLGGPGATVALGTVDAVSRGANGRYLLVRDTRNLSIQLFDPVSATIAQTYAIDEAGAPFACGAAKLFVFQPAARKLERYDLLSKRREAAVPWSGPRPAALVIGPGSDGPLIAITRTPQETEFAAIDPDTLKRGASRTDPAVTVRPSLIRPTADGGLFALGAEPNRGGLLLRRPPGNLFTTMPVGVDEKLVGHVTPSPDGRYLYTAKGVFAADGTPEIRPADDYLYTLPTAHGSGLFLSLNVPGNGEFRGPVRLHLAGSRATAAKLADVEVPGVSAADTNPIPADMRVHLWPAAGLAAVLPAANDRLELRRVNVAKLLREAKDFTADYVVIGSDPPTTAVRDTRWVYRPEVWTRSKPPVALKATGPEGMRVEHGEIVWDVPADMPTHEVEVRIQAECASEFRFGAGVRVTGEQKFRLAVIGAP